MYNPKEAYNDIPLLPPINELETKKVLKQAISATRVLVELKGRADEVPNQSMLVNAITLQGAKDSSEIENIVTTQDNLYQAFTANTNITDAQTKEVLRYRQALWERFNNLDKSSPVDQYFYFHCSNDYRNLSQTADTVKEQAAW
ncbi:Fic/DOC family N-terminal domain-containing protein [Flagellimonas marinaquae]